MKNKHVLPHSKDGCHLRASQIKPYIKLIKELLYNSKTPVVSFTNEYKYVFLSRNLNRKLFELLDRSGFWEFHCSNTKKHMCSLHQIVLYINVGYRLFLLGYTCDSHNCEIHHLDHDPSNNDIDNLVYVTSQENKLLSDICRFTYNGRVKSATINPFGSHSTKGRKGKYDRLIKLIKSTVKATFGRLDITAPVESTYAWLMSLPQKLGQEIIYTWQSLPSKTMSFINGIYN